LRQVVSTWCRLLDIKPLVAPPDIARAPTRQAHTTGTLPVSAPIKIRANTLIDWFLINQQKKKTRYATD
jgi:hypothetical protein